MKYYSTNNRNSKVSFKEAVLKGLAADGGLFMPGRIPQISNNILSDYKSLSFKDLAFNIAKEFTEDEIEKDHLKKITDDAINFDAPLVRLDNNIHILELFHGPTLAFKDFGARFMAGVFSYFNKDNDKELIILVATSGDTGSAVANGFFEVEGIKVVILYPSGKVSEIQEKQLTTLGKNITALEVEGTFDDCQRFVKLAFNDVELISQLNLTSANSINISRLIPQTFYYANALKQIEDSERKIVFSVPSGNFGNLTAGLIANEMGFNVDKFIAAVNINNTFEHYIDSGIFEPLPSIKTLSNAMDVGNPSNFSRIWDLYKNNYENIKSKIYSKSFNDEQTIDAISEVYEKYNYIIDPHGAVGYMAAKKFIDENDSDYQAIILETAHPGKFPETVEKALQVKIEIPENLKSCLAGKKYSIKLPNDYEKLKEILLSM